ncbi:MAG: hypothetical protein EBY29_10285 [Planctomycetes bacterium]|nr:hypothetical protein [Planctomycetota bacterium]
MNQRVQDAAERTRNRPELLRQQYEPQKITMKEKLEGETESQYVERLTAEYKSKMGDATPPALFNRAISFIQAMASKVFELPASEALQAERLEVCFGCEHFVVAIDAPDQVGHCAACGCGKNKMTSLPEKAKILKSTCPKSLWDVTIDPAAVALPIAPPPQ